MVSLPATSPPDTPDDITALDALTLMSRIHARKLSCTEVMQACLSRIAALNPAHLALISMPDPDLLLDQARNLDSKGIDSTAVGSVLHGFPQAPKDLLPAADFPTTMGSRIFADRITDDEAPAFRHLRKQGAIFIGRTNTPEFGLGCHTYNTVHGITRNAFDTAVSAGGSSGGAAVAVALNMLPVADGTDMMGSLRTPAAFNGIYGLRPTPGLVPQGPVNPLVHPPLAAAGPMARNLPDLALLLASMADFPSTLPFLPYPDPAGFTEPLKVEVKGRRLAWAGDLNGRIPLEAGVMSQAQTALKTFETLGCHIEDHVPDFDYESLWQAWIDLRSVLFYQAQKPWLSQPDLFDQVKPEAQWEYERGRQMSQARIDKALDIHRQWQHCLTVTFGDYDHLLLPAVQTPPFDATLHWPATIGEHSMDTYHRWMEIVLPASMGALPALAVPVQRLAANTGTGLQIMGAPGTDLAVMQLGHAYDLALSA